jgi:uncharacterized membrane protein
MPPTSRAISTSSSLSAAKNLDQCSVCGKQGPCRPLATLRPALVEQLRQSATFDVQPPSGAVCTSCLSSALTRHALSAVRSRRTELSEVEAEIAKRASAIAEEIERGVPASFGHRAADAVARIGGSWGFVIGFVSMLLVWCGVNAWALADRAFDPYPFILLNLVLSCIASIQAPIILMSQSRMAQIDRIRATEDFRVNLKAELEVASLHEKMDHVLYQQWDRMLELQEVQLQILEEMRGESATAAPAAAPQQAAALSDAVDPGRAAAASQPDEPTP